MAAAVLDINHQLEQVAKNVPQDHIKILHAKHHAKLVMLEPIQV
jgi:hypothetical protein